MVGAVNPLFAGRAIAALRRLVASGATPAIRQAAATKLAEIGDQETAVRSALTAIRVAERVLVDPESTPAQRQAAQRALETALEP